MPKQQKKKTVKQQKKAHRAARKKSWFLPDNKTPLLVIIGLAVLLYANTLSNGYAVDDSVTNINNQFVAKGFAGIGDILTNDTFTGKAGKKLVIVAGSRYRPLSVVTFAIEKGLFGYSPTVGHLVNLLLYGFTGCLIYLLFSRLLQKLEPPRWYVSVPFITAVLFLLHPVHTEVVANIKGRDEILALIGSLLALMYTIRYLETKQAKYLAFTAIAFFLGLLSKENTITFLAVIPLTVYVFTSYDLKKNYKAFLPIAITTVLYLAIRQAIVGGGGGDAMTDSLINNPFLGATIAEQYGTICYTFGEYLRLLFFPHPLTYDYYPYHIGLTGFGVVSILSLLVYIGLGVFALLKLPSKSVVAYGILFYIITFSIVSNVFVGIGVFMGERFLYFPSLGFCLVIAWLLVEGISKISESKEKQIPLILGALGIIGVLFAGKTIVRNFDWKDNFTLVSQDINVSKNSAKCNFALGELYLKQGIEEKDKTIKAQKLQLALPLLEKAVEVYPGYKSAYSKLADTHYYLGDNKKSIAANINLIRLAPKEATVQNVLALLQQEREPAYQLSVYEQLADAMPQSFITNFNYGRTLIVNGVDKTKGNQFIQKAARVNEQNPSNPNYARNKQQLAPYLKR